MIASTVLHNFIRKYAYNDQEFQPFEDEEELLSTMKVRLRRKRTMKNKVQVHSMSVKYTKNVIKLQLFSCTVNISVILLINILIWLVLFFWKNIILMYF